MSTTMGFMDPSAWREAGASWRERASATLSSLRYNAFNVPREDDDEDNDEDDITTHPAESTPRARSSSARGRCSARSDSGERQGSSVSRPRSADSQKVQPRGRQPFMGGSSGALSFTTTWSSAAVSSVHKPEPLSI